MKGIKIALFYLVLTPAIAALNLPFDPDGLDALYKENRLTGYSNRVVDIAYSPQITSKERYQAITSTGNVFLGLTPVNKQGETVLIGIDTECKETLVGFPLTDRFQENSWGKPVISSGGRIWRLNTYGDKTLRITAWDRSSTSYITMPGAKSVKLSEWLEFKGLLTGSGPHKALRFGAVLPLGRAALYGGFRLYCMYKNVIP